MRIDTALPPAATAATTRRSRPEATDTPPAAPAAPAPAPAPAPAAAPPTEGSAPATHGRGAEHRSDVATLRQWVNHPELRSSITLPDLEAPHKGQGFAKAVEAYQAVIAATAPPAPPTDETPVVTDPVVPPPTDETPVVTDPVVPPPTGETPVVTDPVVPPPTGEITIPAPELPPLVVAPPVDETVAPDLPPLDVTVDEPVLEGA
jgi:hypothetical protein